MQPAAGVVSGARALPAPQRVQCAPIPVVLTLACRALAGAGCARSLGSAQFWCAAVSATTRLPAASRPDTLERVGGLPRCRSAARGPLGVGQSPPARGRTAAPTPVSAHAALAVSAATRMIKTATTYVRATSA
eukprot:7378650-Prymnesium_polylepis.2